MTAEDGRQELIRELICLKTLALTHDPPNKMWTREHEKVAEDFRKTIISGTVLEECIDSALVEKLSSRVRLADSIASSLDRWVLIYWRREQRFLKYHRLHNIFDPTRSEDLPHSLHEEAAWRVAKYINDILKKVDKTCELSTTYNILYLLVEALWYIHGYQPSLADTRVPTHTVFDHLYASASISNIVQDNGLDGYYVIIDFPGVKKFVAGRKAGDLWASSWIISNLMWRTAYSFAEDWGLDTILTPSPRLNPYSFKSLLSTISGRSFFLITNTCDGCDESRREVFERLYGLAAEIYSSYIGDRARLSEVWNQPIVPATISILLPKAVGDRDEVVEKVVQSYENAWRELRDVIIDNLEAGRASRDSIVAKYISHYLGKAKPVLDAPPQGVSIAVVEVGKVFQKLSNCLGSQDGCEDIGLSIDRNALVNLMRKLDARDIALRLLYHLLVESALKLAKSGYGVAVSPLPRPFYYLNPEPQRLERVGGGVLPAYDSICNLCGEEPAIIKMTKKPEKHGIDYSDDVINDIMRVLTERVGEQSKEGGVSESDQVIKMELMKHLKPGEALGPYCLLKRATYLALRKVVRIPSTDDIALMRLSRALSEEFRNLRDKILEKIGEESWRMSLKGLYSYGDIHTDLEVEALAEDLKYETFIQKARELMVKACVDTVKKDESDRKHLADLAKWLLGIDKPPGDTADSSTVRHLCSQLRIQPSYTIVYGDGDNIGEIILGRLGVSIEKYGEAIVDAILESKRGAFEEGEIETIKVVRDSFRDADNLVKALGIKGMIVSPAYHSSISISLVLTALDDYKITREYDGVLIYSGGDDVLALFPVHSAIAAVRKFRESFTGRNHFRVLRIVKKGSEERPPEGDSSREVEVVVASALTTGRSFSVRFTNLKDVMSSEIMQTRELLESHAKRACWRTGDGTREWMKDTLVLSDSRGLVHALLPNKIYIDEGREKSIHDLLLTLSGALSFGHVSGNVPEDFDSFTGGRETDLSDNSVKTITRHVLRRNLRGESLLDSLAPDYVFKVRGSLGKSRDLLLAVELYSKAFRILRRYL